MSHTGRIRTRAGTIDIFQSPETNEVQLATLRRDGIGYRQVTNHKRIFEPGKAIGFSEGLEYDLLVADEFFGFVGIDNCGNPMYIGICSGGKVRLSRDKMPAVLYADDETRIHGENL